MQMTAPPTSTATEQHDREAITLQELKHQLSFVPPSSTAPLSSEESAKLERCIDAFLVRFLRAKHLSVAEAASKLRRRRVFESALPAITVTPSVVACLRSGALRIIGRDLEQRLVLLFDARQLAVWPVLGREDMERLIIMVLLYMEHRCMQCAYETPVAGKATAKEEVSSSYRYRQQMILLINAHDVPAARASASLLRYAPALQPIASKYFPHLVDLVLVVGAPYDTRQAIQSAMTQSAPEFQRAVEMVQDKDLSRFMVPTVIPSSLGGDNQGADQQLGGGVSGGSGGLLPAGGSLETMASAAITDGVTGMTSMFFAEAVLRHWYLVTAFLTMEGTLQRHQPDCPQRPLYMPPPLQFMPPTTSLSVMMKDQARGRDGIVTAGVSGSPTSGGTAGAVQPVFPYFMAVPATVPTLAGLPHVQPSAPTSAISPARPGAGGDEGEDEAGNSPLMGTGMKGSYTSRLRNSATRRHQVPHALHAADGSPVPDPPSQGLGADVEPTTVDDGLCSSLVSSMFVDADGDDDDLGSLDEEKDSRMSNNRARPSTTTRRRREARAAGTVPTAHVTFGTAGAEVDPAEEAKIRADPTYAMRTLQQERGRRLIAEQRVQLAQLGLTMDPHNTSLVERELAAIHEELNVLVSEVLVRSREAAGPNKRPSLSQLLDVTVSVLEASVQEAERVPVISAFAQPVQRDVEAMDNGSTGGCCCTVM